MSDHGSTDDTKEMLDAYSKQYPFIEVAYLERGPNPDYSDAFKYLFTLPKTEWTWTFGDDDILLPDAVKTMLPALKRNEFEFIHVAETSRSEGSGKLTKGTLKDLCMTYGWLDMTGFITGNIIKSAKLKEASELASWPIYAKSAFVQSLALYEVLHGSFSAFLDYPLVEPQTLEVTEDNARRWTEFDIPTRYFDIGEGLDDMRKRGVIDKVNPTFFRYHSYYIWDRFCQNLGSSFTTTQDFKLTEMLELLYEKVLILTTFLPEAEEKRFREEIMELHSIMGQYQFAITKTMQIAQQMDVIIGSHGVERFPFAYTKSLPRDNGFIATSQSA